ncbi:hypothetical protein VTO73DRAFT_5495 [Trametes versicolor]
MYAPLTCRMTPRAHGAIYRPLFSVPVSSPVVRNILWSFAGRRARTSLLVSRPGTLLSTIPHILVSNTYHINAAYSCVATAWPRWTVCS